MIRKIFHIATAIMILISITGFTVNLHFCHDHLIDLALFAPAESCCGSADQVNCQPGNEISHAGHCLDKSIEVGSTDDYVATFAVFDFDHIPGFDLMHLNTTSYHSQATDPVFTGPVPWHKEPPPAGEVILSQIQTYLI